VDRREDAAGIVWRLDVTGCGGVDAGQSVRSGPRTQPGVTAMGMSASEVLEEGVDTPGATPAVLFGR
jgi:hypothetical protein